eukprot:scaffold3941_cov412-Prasinococcus_capsulatus_cf.AAC.8
MWQHHSRAKAGPAAIYAGSVCMVDCTLCGWTGAQSFTQLVTAHMDTSASMTASATRVVILGSQ